MDRLEQKGVSVLCHFIIKDQPDLYLCQLIDEFNGSEPIATEILVDKISSEMFGNDLDDTLIKIENFETVRALCDIEVMKEASKRFRERVILCR